MTKQNIKGYAFIIISAVIFGCMPLMAKHIYSDGVNSITLVLMRNLFSLPLLLALAFISGGSLKISARALPSVGLIGIFGCAVTPLLLFSSYNFMASGSATVFHFVYPAIVVILEILTRKSKAGLGNIMSLVLCVGGVAMFYTPGAEISLAGGALALASGLTYAIYIFLLSSFGSKGTNTFAFSFYVSLVACAVLFIVALISGQLAFPKSVFGWVLSVAFALLVNGLAVVLFQRGTFIIGGERAAILSTLEPITSIIVGAIAFSESVGPLTVLGSILVVAASVIIALSDKIKLKSK